MELMIEKFVPSAGDKLSLMMLMARIVFFGITETSGVNNFC